MSKKSRERQKLRRLAERDTSLNEARAAARAEWLSQFAPLAESELSPTQAEAWAKVKAQFPEAQLGRRSGGRFSFYFFDAPEGGSAGDLPA